MKKRTRFQFGKSKFSIISGIVGTVGSLIVADLQRENGFIKTGLKKLFNSKENNKEVIEIENDSENYEIIEINKENNK